MDEQAIAEAVESLREGDAQALGLLFRAYEPDVLRVCRRFLSDPSQAEDACQEVFLKGQRGLSSFDPDQAFRPWLLAIAGHHCIDVLRRRGVEQRLFDGGEEDAAELPAAAADPIGQLSSEEERRALLRALDALPERYRLPLVLRFFGEEDYASIASVLGVSRNQVATLLFRAKQKLRVALTEARP